MTDVGYSVRYAEMTEGELARLVSEGRDSLNSLAREALDVELRKRGLTEKDLLE